MNFFKNYEPVPYNSKSTILECNKCQRQEEEWYNDQPGDRCGCGGRMHRTIKSQNILYTKEDIMIWYQHVKTHTCDESFEYLNKIKKEKQK